MVAAALAEAGLYAGEPDELLAEQNDNPRGFWERRDVVELNDEVLAANGGSWHSPPQQLVISEDQRGRVAAILARLPTDRAWLLKDPRLVLTWPLWELALEDAVLIYVYRGPSAVASSLQRRNGFPLQLGLGLWQRYNRSALEILPGRTVIPVSYDAIATDSALLPWLSSELVQHGVPCETIAPDAFVASLQHESESDAVVPVLSACQDALARFGQALCENPFDFAVTDIPVNDPELAWRLDDLGGAFAALHQGKDLVSQLENSRIELAERTGERDEVLARFADLERDHNDLVSHLGLSQAELAERTTERDEVLSRFADLDRHHQDLTLHLKRRETELATRISEHEQLAATYRRDADEFRMLEKQLRMSEASATQATQAIENRLHEVNDALDQRIVAHEDSLQRIHELEYSRNPIYLINKVGGALLRGLEIAVLRFLLLLVNVARRLMGREALRIKGVFFEEHTVERPRSKIVLAGDVIKYVARNPAGSARSFSLPRLKRAASVFLHANTEDLGVWINARFPYEEQELVGQETQALDDGFDTLQLVFPPEAAPRLSIVIPVYNQYRMTMQCLQSVLQHSGDVAYEIILADDLSTDLTASITDRVGNITVVRGDRNRGFVENCNAGAVHARGEYLLFLNNDTSVTQDWLEPLCSVLDNDATVGVVGPKLLFADGLLQEAGGIVWDDASGWNYGRADDPEKPAYNYLKEVDYVSGACLMIRHDLWRQIGGFDEMYAPAYYEDTDLAFAARAAGYRVIYQPDSRVYHFEGVSNGVELDAGLKQYQLINQQTFLEKWQAQLTQDHFPNAVRVFRARDRSRYRRTVLIIDHYVPHYDKDAGSRSTFMYVKLMVEMGYRVMFLGANFFPHKPYTQTLQQLGVEVLVGEWMARNQDAWLKENAAEIDCIYLHRPHIAEQVLDSLDKMEPRPPIIYFGHDLHYLRTERELEVSGNSSLAREAKSWRRREYAVFDRVDKVYYPSQIEVDEVAQHRPQLAARAIPLYALEDRSQPVYRHQERSGILFVGGFNHPPNVDGIVWFVDEVMPRIAPDIQLHVVGSNPSDAVQDLQSERVQVYGYLSDEELDAIYGRVSLAVVPLRFGAGVKGKVLEALQQGVPLVTTSIGAEGIPDAGEVMHIADDAETMAELVLAVDQGAPDLLDKTLAYADYLQRHFSKSRAAAILREDFGEPITERLVAPESTS